LGDFDFFKYFSGYKEFLEDKGIGGQNRFWAGSYGLNICFDFLNFLVKIKKTLAFQKYKYYFIGAQEQKL